MRSVVVAPGMLDVGMGAALGEAEREKKVGRSLAGLGDGGSVAATIAFLTSPAADYINAEVIRCDGGIRY